MSAKYYKRGTREYYQVTPERVIRIVNYFAKNEITIASRESADSGIMVFILNDAMEGIEISRDEFKKQFDEAAKLIVLEP